MDKLEYKNEKEQRRHDTNMVLVDTAKAALANPIGIMILGSLANQQMYNAGMFNPRDPNHTISEDWEAGSAVSDWIFFATLTVAACMAAQTAADILPSISDFI